MIENQTVTPFRATKKGMKANQAKNAGNKQMFKASSTLEKSPSADNYNGISAHPQKSNSNTLGIALGFLGLATIGSAVISHKNSAALQKILSEKSASKATDAPVATPIIEAATKKVEVAIDKGLSIWGNTYLKLQKGGEIKPETVTKIRNEIASSLDGDYGMKKYAKTKLVSVSYEGWGAKSGGQHDVANELPVAFKQANVDTTIIAPLFKISESKDGKVTPKFSLTPVEGKENTFIYRTPTELPGMPKGQFEIEVTKIYDAQMTGSTDKLQVFHAKVGPDNVDALFVHDDRLFNIGETPKPNIYCDTASSKEKTRMAQFNNMTYELLMKIKQGEIKIDGQAMEAPNKMVAHEAWQSGGLLQKMKLFSHVEEADNVRGEKSAELGAYARELANNTGVVIHNIGDGYQGWPRVLDKEKPFEPMEEYYNTLYGKYAEKLVENSLVDDLIGTEDQRVGFVGDWMNPAHASVILATKLGSVSEGYTEELAKSGLSVRLDHLLGIKKENGGLVSFPNGVDKKSHTASAENVDKINTKLVQMNRTERIQAYLETHTSKIDPNNPAEASAFEAKLIANKKAFLGMLKDAVQGYKTAPKPEKGAKTFSSPIFNEYKFKGFHGNENYADLSDLNIDNAANIPIFSMASRLDSQKGFDTMADAILIKSKQWMADPANAGKERPIFFISGDGDEHLSNYLAKTQAKIHAMDPELAKRVLFTKDRLSDEGLLLTNMTTTSVMSSDFEPYGISDIKGAYGGARLIVTDVGGMKASGSISRKVFGLHEDPAKANAIVVTDYKYMCTAKPEDRKQIRRMNAKKLAAAFTQDINLSRAQAIRMNINAINSDVSWEKGAIQNYKAQMLL